MTSVSASATSPSSSTSFISSSSSSSSSSTQLPLTPALNLHNLFSIDSSALTALLSTFVTRLDQHEALIQKQEILIQKNSPTAAAEEKTENREEEEKQVEEEEEERRRSTKQPDAISALQQQCDALQNQVQFLTQQVDAQAATIASSAKLASSSSSSSAPLHDSLEQRLQEVERKLISFSSSPSSSSSSSPDYSTLIAAQDLRLDQIETKHQQILARCQRLDEKIEDGLQTLSNTIASSSSSAAAPTTTSSPSFSSSSTPSQTALDVSNLKSRVNELSSAIDALAPISSKLDKIDAAQKSCNKAAEEAAADLRNQLAEEVNERRRTEQDLLHVMEQRLTAAEEKLPVVSSSFASNAIPSSSTEKNASSPSPSAPSSPTLQQFKDLEKAHSDLRTEVNRQSLHTAKSLFEASQQIADLKARINEFDAAIKQMLKSSSSPSSSSSSSLKVLTPSSKEEHFVLNAKIEDAVNLLKSMEEKHYSLSREVEATRAQVQTLSSSSASNSTSTAPPSSSSSPRGSLALNYLSSALESNLIPTQMSQDSFTHVHFALKQLRSEQSALAAKVAQIEYSRANSQRAEEEASKAKEELFQRLSVAEEGLNRQIALMGTNHKNALDFTVLGLKQDLSESQRILSDALADAASRLERDYKAYVAQSLAPYALMSETSGASIKCITCGVQTQTVSGPASDKWINEHGQSPSAPTFSVSSSSSSSSAVPPSSHVTEMQITKGKEVFLGTRDKQIYKGREAGSVAIIEGDRNRNAGFNVKYFPENNASPSSSASSSSTSIASRPSTAVVARPTTALPQLSQSRRSSNSLNGNMMITAVEEEKERISQPERPKTARRSSATSSSPKSAQSLIQPSTGEEQKQ